MGRITIEKVEWKDISHSIGELNPPLFKAMSAVYKNLNGKNYLYKMNVPYLQDIIINGRASIGIKEHFMSSNPAADVEYEELLDDLIFQAQQPLTLILDGIVEIYRNAQYKYGEQGKVNYTYPAKIFKKGDVFGTYESMDFLLRLKGENYSYSASSGHKSIFPILPSPERKTPRDYVRSCARHIDSLYKDEPDSRGKKINAVDIFPYVLKEIAPSIDYTTSLLLIPNFWYAYQSEATDDMKNYISKLAWFQASDSKKYNESIIKTYDWVAKSSMEKKESNIYLAAQFIQYFDQAYRGEAPVLKLNFDSEYEYLYQIHDLVKEHLQYDSNFFFFYFEFLNQGDSGVLPLVPIPVNVNSASHIRNATVFYEQIEEVFAANIKYESNGVSINKNDIELFEAYKESWKNFAKYKYKKNSPHLISEYFQKKFPDEKLHELSFFHQIIVEVQRDLD